MPVPDVLCCMQGTLNKWRDDRGAAQHAMQAHSQWLAKFREQVACVAQLQQQQQQLHSTTILPGSATAAATLATAGRSQGSGNGTGGGADADGDRSGAVLANTHHSGGGSMLSPVASSSLVGVPSVGSLSAGQPVTVDLGGNQELVITVVPKQAPVAPAASGMVLQ